LEVRQTLLSVNSRRSRQYPTGKLRSREANAHRTSPPQRKDQLIQLAGDGLHLALRAAWNVESKTLASAH
jgi:hypothetical protein